MHLSRPLITAIVLLLMIAALGAFWGGPPLGDHETIVAECARNMRLTGDWLVPRFLDTPFLRKPPLPYWLVAGVSYLFPDDPRTGLPVTTAAARLPSALAAFGTALLLWRLGSAMFGRRTGAIAAIIAASSLCFMLYAPNATVEMVLTFCCTWACLHFWFAVTSRSAGRRYLHMLLFYIALGLAMLAKGPAPLALVALPLAVWWYTHRALRVLARRGRAGIRLAAVVFMRDLKTRTVQAFTRLGLVPGLVVFGLVFIPWMIAAAGQDPEAWKVWNWQYLQRAEGDYLDTRPRGVFYYLPRVFGLTVPWLFLLPEALIGPWMKRYAGARRGLLFCGIWAVVGITVMSLEPFKKPYYIVPAIPALILMMAVVAERFYAARPRWAGLAWALWGVSAVALIVGLFFGLHYIRQEFPHLVSPVMIIAAGAVVLLLIAGGLYIRGRGWWAIGLTAMGAVAAFHSFWFACGSAIGNLEKITALSHALDAAGVPTSAQVMWADQRPDARLNFYFGRQSRYLVTPAEIVSRVLDRTQGRTELMMMVVERASQVLTSPEPVYLILSRNSYNLMKPTLAKRAFLVDSVHAPNDPARKDWMVVSNVKHPRPAEEAQ